MTVLVLFSFSAAAQPAGVSDIEAVLGDDGRFLSPPVGVSESAMLGLMIPQVLEEYGSPQRLFSIRGDESWQDDVVFFYNGFVYFYWFEDRVWQVRFDHRHNGTVAGVKMGQTFDEVIAALGSPHYVGSNEIFFDAQDRGFPIRLRLVFEDDRLHDLYLYRSDF